MAPVMGTLFYREDVSYKAQKALITAKFAGLALETKILTDKDCEDSKLFASNPARKVPFMHTDDACIFTTNAMARYIARCRGDMSLYGKCFDDEGQVDTWLEFGSQNLEIPLAVLVYPVLGLMSCNEAMTRQAQSDVKAALATLEEQLTSNKFLIGDFVSLADISLVCSLRDGFTRVLEPAFRKPFPKVCEWFEACCNLPQFKAVLGEVKLCVQAEKPKPVAKAPAPKPGKASPKKSPKAAPAAAPAPAVSGGGAVDEAAIKKVGDEIRVLKEKLKAEGLSGKKINEHAEVKTLVEKLTALKAGGAAAPATAAVPAAGGGGDLDAQITACGDEIRVLKEKLKAEGLSGKKVNEHAEVKTLVAKLQELKASQAK